MDGRKEGVGRFSVPAFGEWDGKIGVPDYSIDFSRIREHRRQSKSRVSLGNEEELLCSSTGNGNHSSESLQNNQQLPQHKGSSTVFRFVLMEKLQGRYRHQRTKSNIPTLI